MRIYLPFLNKQPEKALQPKFGASDDRDKLNRWLASLADDSIDLNRAKGIETEAAIKFKDDQAEMVADLILALPEDIPEGQASHNLYTMLDDIAENDPRRFIRILKSLLEKKQGRFSDRTLSTLWENVRRMPANEYMIQKLNDAPAWSKDRCFMMAFLEISGTFRNLLDNALKQQQEAPGSEKAVAAQARLDAFRTNYAPVAPMLAGYLNALWQSQGKDEHYRLSPEATELDTACYMLEYERQSQFANDGFNAWRQPRVINKADIPAFISEMENAQLELMQTLYRQMSGQGKARCFWSDSPWGRSEGLRQFQEAMVLDALTPASRKDAPELFERALANLTHIQDPTRRLKVFKKFWSTRQPAQVRHNAGRYYRNLEQDPKKLMKWLDRVLTRDPHDQACIGAMDNLIHLGNAINRAAYEQEEVPEQKIMDAFLKKWYNHPRVASNAALRARMVRQSTFDNRTVYGSEKLREWYGIFSRDTRPEVKAATLYFICMVYMTNHTGRENRQPFMRAYDLFAPALKPDEAAIVRESAADALKIYVDQWRQVSQDERRELIRLYKNDGNEKVRELVKYLEQTVENYAENEQRRQQRPDSSDTLH